MGLIILGHGQDRDHGDASLLALLTSGTLIQRCQVSVHVTRISTATRNLFTGCRYLTQGICVVGNICQDNQNVHIFLKSQVLGGSQRHTGCSDTLYGRVVGQVDKQYGTVNGTCFFKAFYEEVGFLEGNTHGGKYNGKLLIFTAYLGLSGDLGGQLGMGQTGS